MKLGVFCLGARKGYSFWNDVESLNGDFVKSRQEICSSLDVLYIVDGMMLY